MANSITREGGDIVIRMPIEEAQSLRVALQPCPCKGTKSVATDDIRQRLIKGLGRAIFKRVRVETV